MKEERGTIKLVNQAVKHNPEETIHKMMNIAKNVYFTGRQTGVPEVFYEMLPTLNVLQSNLVGEFIPSEFQKIGAVFSNRFMKIPLQIFPMLSLSMERKDSITKKILLKST